MPPDVSPHFVPSDQYWDIESGHPAINYVDASNGRRLAVIGDTLYMVDVARHLLWTWSAMGPPLTDLPIIDSRGTIYAIGFDLVWVAIDGESGKVIWTGTACGRAVYTQIGLLSADRYFVVTDMSGYRENHPDAKIPDSIDVCQGNHILWQGTIPTVAKVHVRDGKPHVRLERGGRIRSYRLRIPEQFGAPIGQVSAIYKGQAVE